LARIKGFPGYVEIMLDNPINPLIWGIGVQTNGATSINSFELQFE
jgi:hypothetical protein